ncbi:MAG: hypothetical protein QMC36_06805, partial [Patescibacteria group bacterium]
VHAWDVAGLLPEQAESAKGEESYFKHVTERDWEPLFPRTHDAVRDRVPHPQVAEHAPQLPYDHVPVSQEHGPQTSELHAFATQEFPFAE